MLLPGRRLQSFKNMFNLFKKPAFGLDISDYSVEALELERKFGKVYLGAYGRVKLEEGIVENGKILNKEKLKEKINQVLENTVPRKLKGKKVILSLPESKTFIHFFEERENIEEQASKTIPLDLEKVYSDFQNGLYAAAPKEIVDEYLEVLKEAGLEPLVFDVESASLARAFKNEMVKDGSETPVLIVDIGARTTNLTVYDQGSIRLSTIISIAGNDFTKAISEKLNISLEEAEKLKRSFGLNEEEKRGRVVFVLLDVLKDVLNEIKQTVGFYQEKSGREIKKVLLCGGSSLVPKLLSYFSSNLGIETKLADPWKDIKTEIKITKEKFHPILFASVIGLAKRTLVNNPETAGINLMPLEEKPKPAFIGVRLDENKIFRFLIIGLTVAAFIFLGWVIYAYILQPVFFRTLPTETPLTEEELLLGEEIMPEEQLPSPESLEDNEKEKIPKVIIQETPTGWLRVREGPGTEYPEMTKVYPGESYPQLTESAEWYKIELEGGREGWISANYATTE